MCVKVKKASYDQEVETARANAELAFKLQVYTTNEGPGSNLCIPRNETARPCYNISKTEF
jgi:hypothetical protein